jgi:hypothetical protein
MSSPVDTAAVRDYLLGLQGRIVAAFEAEDGKTFRRDGWQRPAGGKLEGDGLSQLVERAACARARRLQLQPRQGRRRCRPAPPSTGPSWPARPSRPWA